MHHPPHERLSLSGIQLQTATVRQLMRTIGGRTCSRRGSSRRARQIGVLNAGISGAKLLKDRMGVNALARFDRDALSIPGVETVVVMIGINDIGWPGGVLSPTDPPVSVDDLIMGYRQLIAQAHARNIRIIGATLTPFEDTFKGVNPPLDYYYSPEKEKTRQAVNKWIRESKEYDGVIDFDALARDPQRPSPIQAAFDSGDHLHPGDSGYKAMADSIDLKMLTTQP